MSKKIKITSLEQARTFVGRKARLFWEGYPRGEGIISVRGSLEGFHVKTAEDAQPGCDAVSVFPGMRTRGEIEILDQSAKEILDQIATHEREAKAQAAALSAELSEAVAREAAERVRASEQKALDDARKAREDADAKWALPDGWRWERTFSDLPKAVTNQSCAKLACGVGKDQEFWQTRDKRIPPAVVRVVLDRWDAENAPENPPVPAVSCYSYGVFGMSSSEILREYPAIREGDRVRLTMDSGAEYERTLTLTCGVEAVGGYPHDDGHDSDDSAGRCVSGYASYGVSRITLLARAKPAYSLETHGRPLSELDHEFVSGDRVALTHENGTVTEHEVVDLWYDGDIGVSPKYHGVAGAVTSVVNFGNCLRQVLITKITRL